MSHLFKTIAKAERNGKTYKITKDDENKIIFAVKENGVNRIELTEDEKVFFAQFYNSLKVDKETTLNLGIIKINNKNIQIFYDYRIHFYYWFEIIDGKMYETDEETNRILNFRYNHVKDYVVTKQDLDKTKSNNEENFIKRFIRVGKEKLAVLVIAGLSIGTLTGCTISQGVENVPTKTDIGGQDVSIATQINKEDTITTTSETTANNPTTTITSTNNLINTESTFRESIVCTPYKETRTLTEDEKAINDELNKRVQQKYDWKEIEDAIKYNTNLQENEKNILLNLKPVIDENYKYMDLDTIIERLRYLNITFEDNSEEMNSITVAGYYNVPNNTITYNENYRNSPEIIIHELLHVLQVQPIEYRNRATYEITNEMLARETVGRLQDADILGSLNLKKIKSSSSYYLQSVPNGKNVGGYPFLIPYGIALSECLTQEQLKQYEFCPSDEVLVNALLSLEDPAYTKEEYDKQLERAYKLMDNFDRLNDIHDAEIDESELSKVEGELKENLSYYYQKKHNRALTDDIVSSAVFSSISETTAFSKLMEEKIANWSKELFRGIKNKTYFSDYCQSSTITYYGEDGEWYELQIDDDLEKEYKAYKEECGEIVVYNLANNVEKSRE